MRDWTPDAVRGGPVVCLPGLSRTLEDFVPLARRLSAAGRRVIAISARGRGLSDRDADPTRYQVKIEAEDALAVLDDLDIEAATWVGTSRGGLQAMMIGALRPQAVRAVVLNDIGPEIEPDGLKQIRRSLQESWRPASFAEAADRLRLANGARFPALGPQDYDGWARRAWVETEAGFEPASDPALARIFDGVDLDQPIPPLWALFDALKETPLMVVRGEFSDILSEPQLARIVERRPDVAVHRVAGQGHAPLLDDRPAIEAIVGFLDQAGV
ncbi:alpha/beta hydrolase [Methylopila sp. M107]|uniref:alpha/beta fold hydrolase n=1 Tax=Methylopila sp. M107 TaxID=1101190 RepID=UPI0003799A55|nr:alpha/beta hydrolase [Methylopila sp. M107]